LQKTVKNPCFATGLVQFSVILRNWRGKSISLQPKEFNKLMSAFDQRSFLHVRTKQSSRCTRSLGKAGFDPSR
jgi:hypothetical protein